MSDELTDKSYVDLRLYNVPNMKMGLIYVKNLLADAPDEILNSEITDFDIEFNKEYGYFMFTIFIKM
jgi:hypothetical protein